MTEKDYSVPNSIGEQTEGENQSVESQISELTAAVKHALKEQKDSASVSKFRDSLGEMFGDSDLQKTYDQAVKAFLSVLEEVDNELFDFVDGNLDKKPQASDVAKLKEQFSTATEVFTKIVESLKQERRKEVEESQSEGPAT